ncbi:MAG: endonuclease/exonuclease/phosphatase family protein, partial [Bdellovibrionota bacterium]
PYGTLSSKQMRQLAYIADAVGMRSMIGPTLQRDYGAYGNAILYRAPLVSALIDAETCDLSFRKFEPRGAIAAHFRLDFGILRIVSCHLGLKYWERTFQIDRLLKEFVRRDGALTCLAGDFNEWISFSPNAARLAGSFSGPPRRATFPSAWPRLALDRIFFNWPVRMLESFAVSGTPARVASDHLPLVATFEWNERDSWALS